MSCTASVTVTEERALWPGGKGRVANFRRSASCVRGGGGDLCSPVVIPAPWSRALMRCGLRPRTCAAAKSVSGSMVAKVTRPDGWHKANLMRNGQFLTFALLCAGLYGQR